MNFGAVATPAVFVTEHFATVLRDCFFNKCKLRVYVLYRPDSCPCVFFGASLGIINQLAQIAILTNE